MVNMIHLTSMGQQNYVIQKIELRNLYYALASTGDKESVKETIKKINKIYTNSFNRIN